MTRPWAELIAAMEAERKAGTDPDDPEVQSLAARWRELMEYVGAMSAG